MSRLLFIPGSSFTRLAAKMLDEFLLIPVLVMLAMLFGNSALTLLSLFLVPLLYHMLMHTSHRQATVGEHIMRLYVITRRGERLTLRQSLERSLAYAMPSLPVFSATHTSTEADLERISLIVMALALCWFAPILFTRNATGVHDILCDTRVVRGRIT